MPLLHAQKKIDGDNRPENVPSSAVSAIGEDGGAWADCSFVKTSHAYCVTYFSSTGDMWSQGNYIFMKNNEKLHVQSEAQLKQLMEGFYLFNGHTISLADAVRLVPDGLIDSPFPQGGGKTVKYSLGNVIRPAEQYDK